MIYFNLKLLAFSVLLLSVPAPLSMASPEGMSKSSNTHVLMAVMGQGGGPPKQQELIDIYKPVVSRNDYVYTHPNASNLDYAFKLPGTKGVQYLSLAEIQKDTLELKARGVKFISYDLERGLSPESDTRNLTKSVHSASKTVHDAGLLFMLAPGAFINREYASEFAKVADIYNPQGQTFQKDPYEYQEYYRNITSIITKANPATKIIAEVSVAQARGSVDNMKKSFSLVAPLVDGVTVWYRGNETQQLKQFTSWFNDNY